MKLQLDRDKAQEPAIYVGSFATGDTVMKSTEDMTELHKQKTS